MRAVLDTNVLVSSVIITGSVPNRILRLWESGAFEAVTSTPLLEELRAVMLRGHILRRLGWTEFDVSTFVASFAEHAILVAPPEPLRVSNDPADNRVLEAAVEGAADYVVTGDKGLLALGAIDNIPIVTPARFAAVLSSEQSFP